MTRILAADKAKSVLGTRAKTAARRALLLLFAMAWAATAVFASEATAAGPITIENKSARPVTVEFYKGDSSIRCRGLAVAYKEVKLKAKETKSVGCRGGNGCIVDVKVKNGWGHWFSPPGYKYWSCARIKGPADLTITGDWPRAEESFIVIKCTRTGEKNKGEDCLIRGGLD